MGADIYMLYDGDTIDGAMYERLMLVIAIDSSQYFEDFIVQPLF